MTVFDDMSEQFKAEEITDSERNQLRKLAVHINHEDRIMAFGDHMWDTKTNPDIRTFHSKAKCARKGYNSTSESKTQEARRKGFDNKLTAVILNTGVKHWTTSMLEKSFYSPDQMKTLKRRIVNLFIKKGYIIVSDPNFVPLSRTGNGLPCRWGQKIPNMANWSQAKIYSKVEDLTLGLNLTDSELKKVKGDVYDAINGWERIFDKDGKYIKTIPSDSLLFTHVGDVYMFIQEHIVTKILYQDFEV